MIGYRDEMLVIWSWVPELQSFFAIPEIYQVEENSLNELLSILYLGIESSSVFKAASDQLGTVVPIEIEGVKIKLN